MGRSVWKTFGAIAVWAAVHSLLATKRSKALAARLLGRRRRDGLYRLGYNGVAVVSTFALVVYLHRLPDRTMYHVRGAGRFPLSAARLFLLAVMFAAAVEIGLGPFSGSSEALALLAGEQPEEPPEAQGPAMRERRLRTGGPFRYVRHPLNAGATAIVFLTPKMTEVRLAVAVATLVYALLGSKLEEHRLLDQYGEPYRRYRESGVPFFVPSLRPRAIRF